MRHRHCKFKFADSSEIVSSVTTHGHGGLAKARGAGESAPRVRVRGRGSALAVRGRRRSQKLLARGQARGDGLHESLGGDDGVAVPAVDSACSRAAQRRFMMYIGLDTYRLSLCWARSMSSKPARLSRALSRSSTCSLSSCGAVAERQR